ncbi:MAG: hypothetical protein M3Q82_10220, partial [Actinomycetota bacterium]|nr:hypothetical protein [Actinomycetota bacterium]
DMELGASEIADEVAAGAIVWANTLLSIDHIAHTQARALDGPWRGRWHTARNKLVNQIRPFAGSPDANTESWFDDLSMAMAMTKSVGRGSREELLGSAAQLRKQLVAEPDWSMRMAQDHDEKAVETLTQLWRPENMPKADPNAPFDGASPTAQVAGPMVDIGASGRAGLMQKYMPQIWERFGNWPKFTAATDQVRRLRSSGLLDPAELLPAHTRTGKRSHITDVTRRSREVEEANSALTDAALATKNPDRLRDTATTPFAPGVLPGRITVEQLGTKSGQQIFELREEVADLLDARAQLRHLDRMAGGPGPRASAPLLPARTQAGTAQQAPDWRGALAGVDMNSLTAQQIGHLVRDTFPGSNAADSMRYIVSFAKRKGVSVDQLTSYIEGEAIRLAEDAGRWDEFGLPVSLADDNGRTLMGFDALKARAADLHERWQYAAKEVDLDKLKADYRAVGRHADAQRVEALAAGLAGDGYKLVHGVEFAMPEDLALVPGGIWSDVTRKHLNYATLGNFFKGRLPAEGHIVSDLRHRGALVRELADLKDSPLREARADSEEVDGILGFLQRWLTDDQDRVEALTRHMDLGSRTRRTGQRLLTSMTPVNVEDLQQRGGEIRKALKDVGYSDDEARAITRATAKFRNTSFSDMGLYAFEAKARSGNQAAWALKTLSGAKYGESFLKRGRGHRLVGTFVGAAAGREAADENDSFEERLGKVALGALGGAAAATVAPNVLKYAADPLALKARDWRYGYMADNLARARDSLRFTLSPIFDASR